MSQRRRRRRQAWDGWDTWDRGKVTLCQIIDDFLFFSIWVYGFSLLISFHFFLVRWRVAIFSTMWYGWHEIDPGDDTKMKRCDVIIVSEILSTCSDLVFSYDRTNRARKLSKPADLLSLIHFGTTHKKKSVYSNVLTESCVWDQLEG